MNLVFLSNQIKNENDETDDAIVQLLKQQADTTITYIPSQSDTNRFYFNATKAYYEYLGINVKNYFDVDNEYDENRVNEILKVGAIHLSGGSTFHFLQNIQRRGFIHRLKSFVNDGGILIGVSAGAILMSPSIVTSTICGDPIIEGMSTDALNLTDWEFVPHLNSLAKEDDIMKYSMKSERRILACTDNEGIVVANDELRYIGKIREYYQGNYREFVNET